MMTMRNKVTRTSSSSRKSFRSENRGGRALRTLFVVCALFAVFLSSSFPQRRPSATTKENNFGNFLFVGAQTSGTETEATVAEATPCDTSVPPLNGAVGTCANVLDAGKTCQPTCDKGYTVSGKTTCVGGVLEAATCEFYFCNSDPDTFFKEEGLGDLKNYFCAVEDTVMTTTLKPTNNEWEAEGNTLTYELICPPDRTLKVGAVGNEVAQAFLSEGGVLSFTPDTHKFSESKTDLSLFSFRVTKTVYDANGEMLSQDTEVSTGRIYIEPRNDPASWPDDVEDLTFGQQVRPNKLTPTGTNSGWQGYTFESFQTATAYALPTESGTSGDYNTYILRGNLNCIDASNVGVSADGFVNCASGYAYGDLDADQDYLQYVITKLPTYGEVRLSCDYTANNGKGAQLCGEDAGAFVYIPYGNNSGLSDTFEYAVNDVEAGGHEGLDPPTGLPAGTRGVNSASRRVKITVAEKTFLPSITGVKELVTNEVSTTANVVEDTKTDFSVKRAVAADLPHSGKDKNGEDASITESMLRVYTAQNSFYDAVTDVDGYETVEHGRIKWHCWDEGGDDGQCEGNVCAQEHSGEQVTVNELTMYTCDCEPDPTNNIFEENNFWQTCTKKVLEAGTELSAYFTYEPTKDRGGVDEELWMRIGVKDGIVTGFNYETATVLISVVISQVDDGSELGVYGKDADGVEVLKTSNPMFTAPMTVTEVVGTTKEELSFEEYAKQWQEFKIKAADEDTDRLFITLINANDIQGTVTHLIQGVQTGDLTMGTDLSDLYGSINVVSMGGNKETGFSATLYYRAKEYWRGPMETLKFAVSQQENYRGGDDNAQIIEVTFSTKCAPGHTKNSLETQCTPCGFGEYAQLFDMISCSPCAAGTFAGKTGSEKCEPCGVTSYQPFEGKRACTACPSRSTTEGGAIALTECLCDVGTYGNLRTVIDDQTSDFDSICKVCPPLGSRCTERGLIVPEAEFGYFVDIPDAALGTELTIRECTPEQACPGNATDDQILADVYPWTIQCTEGYEEKGCAQCSNNYYRLKQQCNICPDTKWESYLILFLMLVGFIMLLPILVKLLRRFKAISLLFVFVQITAVLSDLDFKWPPIIQNLYKYFAIFTFDIQLLQPECHIPKFDFFLRYFVVVLSPLFFGATFVLITLLKFIIGQVLIRMLLAGSFDSWFAYDTRDVDDEGNRRGKLQRMKERAKKMITDKKIQLEEFSVGDHIRSTARMFIRIMLTLMDISYIFLSRATLEYFDCVKNPANGISYLEAEPSIQCYDWGNMKNPWTQYFPIALVLVCMYPFGIILTFYFTLYRIRDKLNRPDTVKTFGFLYVGYRPAWYRYKILVLLRQLGVVGSTMLFSQGTTMSQLGQSLGCMMTIFIAMTIHFFADPQESKRLDRLESAAIFISFVNIFSGLIFLTEKASKRFDDFLSWFNAVLILGGLTIFLIYIFMEVTPFVVKSAKSNKGIVGVFFGDSKGFKGGKESKNTTADKLAQLDKRLSKKISTKAEKQKSLEKGPSLYRRMTLGSKRDILTPEELRAEARSKFVNSQLKEASKNVLDKHQRDYLQQLPVEEEVLEKYRTEYVNPETMDEEFTELNESGVDIQAQWIVERHLPAPFTRVHAVDILKRVNDLLDRARQRQKSVQGVNMLGSLKPSGLFSLIRKGVIPQVADNLMRIRLTADDGPNKVVSKVVPLATEGSKSRSLVVMFYGWVMRRLGFNVAENDTERKIRTRAALKAAFQKDRGAANIMERLKKQRSEAETKEEGDGGGNPKKLSLVEKIKAQQKLEEQKAANEAAKRTGAPTSKPEAPPEASNKEQDAPQKPATVEKKPSALERLRSVAGGGKKEEKKEDADEKEKK